MSEMALEFKLRKFTVDEFHHLTESGVLRRDERVELLEGAIVEMRFARPRHWDRHSRIVEYLNSVFEGRALIAGKASLPLGDRNETQPDIAVLRRRSYSPPALPPAPWDVCAVVEISDSSLAKDIEPKKRLYARYGVPDYLVVDLDGNALRHYRDPNDVGYRVCDLLRHGDILNIAALHGQHLAADRFLEDHR